MLIVMAKVGERPRSFMLSINPASRVPICKGIKNKIFATRKNLLIALALMLVVVIAIGIFIDKIMEYNQLQNEKKAIEDRIEAKQEEIDELEYQYDKPMDDEYIESVAKSELDLVNPDDIIVYKDVEGKEE